MEKGEDELLNQTESALRRMTEYACLEGIAESNGFVTIQDQLLAAIVEWENGNSESLEVLLNSTPYVEIKD